MVDKVGDTNFNLVEFLFLLDYPTRTLKLDRLISYTSNYVIINKYEQLKFYKVHQVRVAQTWGNIPIRVLVV